MAVSVWLAAGSVVDDMLLLVCMGDIVVCMPSVPVIAVCGEVDSRRCCDLCHSTNPIK